MAIRTIAIICFIITVSVIADAFKLPMTPLDILLLPLSVFLFIAGLRIRNPDSLINHKIILQLSAIRFVAYCAVFISLILLSLFMLVVGTVQPLQLHTGVKGALHGYSLICLSLMLLLYTSYGTYAVIKTRFAKY